MRSQALQSYWKSLDKHAKHVSQEVSAVQNARYENGLGTRYLSEEAQRYLGVDKYGRALKEVIASSPFKLLGNPYLCSIRLMGRALVWSRSWPCGVDTGMP